MKTLHIDQIVTIYAGFFDCEGAIADYEEDPTIWHWILVMMQC